MLWRVSLLGYTKTSFSICLKLKRTVFWHKSESTPKSPVTAVHIYWPTRSIMLCPSRQTGGQLHVNRRLNIERIFIEHNTDSLEEGGLGTPQRMFSKSINICLIITPEKHFSPKDNSISRRHLTSIGNNIVKIRRLTDSFPRVQFTICQHWFRLSEPMMGLFTDAYIRHSASMS